MREAFLSQLAGIIEALKTNEYPERLKTISIIEINYDRALRLQNIADSYLVDVTISANTNDLKIYSMEIDDESSNSRQDIEQIIHSGNDSSHKKHIVVAMPFGDNMKDVFYYGIQNPVHSCNFLCERVDQVIFTGDILARLKQKIETASAIIADLSFNKPNVYLEVGYALAIKKPVILIIDRNHDPGFNLQGYRILKYYDIKGLEEMLSQEIKGLIKNGIIC